MVAGRPARGLQVVQNTCRLPENSMQTVQNTFRQTKNQFASRAKSFLVDQIPFYKPCKAHLVDQIPFYKPCKILFGAPDSISQAMQTPFGGPDSILQALQPPCGSTRYHFARFLISVPPRLRVQKCLLRCIPSDCSSFFQFPIINLPRIIWKKKGLSVLLHHLKRIKRKRNVCELSRYVPIRHKVA